LPVRNTWTTRTAQRHVVISLVAFSRIIVEIERCKPLAQHAGKFGHVFIERWHGIEPANRHLARAVAIEVEESKRVFPVETRVGKRLRRSMNFQKKSVGGVIRQTVF